MADNASITILRNTQANINAEPIKDGNILFTTDQSENKIYADVGTTRIKIGGTVDVDTTLSTSSTNPVQNKVITNSIDDIRRQVHTVDTTLSTTSTNPVQNKVITNSINDAAGKLQTEVDDVRGQIRTNLLNPTAPTQTINGVTLTNNGDGTYTVNGTATGDIYFRLQQNFNISAGTYRLNCCVSPSYGEIYCYLQSDRMLMNEVTGIATIPNSSDCRFILRIASGQVLTNEVIKPMLTTDLNAKYDDYVPYTGDSGRLNEDVAALFDKVEEHEEEIEQINADLSKSLYKTTGLEVKEITIPNATLPPNAEYRLSLANYLPSNLQFFYIMACNFDKYAVPYIGTSTSYLGLDVLDFTNRSIIFRYSSDWYNMTLTLKLIVAYK